jgi:hypothetical protein
MVYVLIFNRPIKAARCKLKTQKREGTEVRTEIEPHTLARITQKCVRSKIALTQMMHHNIGNTITLSQKKKAQLPCVFTTMKKGN